MMWDILDLNEKKRKKKNKAFGGAWALYEARIGGLFP